MKQAVAKYPSINLIIIKETTPSLLDFGSMVSMMWQDYFDQYFKCQLRPVEGSKAEVT